TELIIKDNKNYIKSSSRIIIGTSAILYREEISKLNIKTLIVDEQHKFGVKQREMILDMFNYTIPNYVNLSATPIPRSVAQILFGDVDVHYLHEKPEGRKPIKTLIYYKNNEEKLLNWLEQKASDQSQIFWVCSLVEDKKDEYINVYENSQNERSSVKQRYKKILKTTKIPTGILYGNMKDTEKISIIDKFKKGELKMLVTSSVIEIGIDIKEADIIIIEDPENFGLSQLHQMRGRVGRNNKDENWCILLINEDAKNNSKVINRLKFFVENNDGIKIAEYDMLNRGPGEIYGLRQSGLPNFKVASLQDYFNNQQLIESKAKEFFYKGIHEIPFF
ncbi:MAG: helicase-related protein, partial [Candidatus Dojkabacteria bacterium]|nr:helicase-related protein [Candidatus Dojkabacteria bacterium]